MRNLSNLWLTLDYILNHFSLNMEFEKMEHTWDLIFSSLTMDVMYKDMPVWQILYTGGHFKDIQYNTKTPHHSEYIAYFPEC